MSSLVAARPFARSLVTAALAGAILLAGCSGPAPRSEEQGSYPASNRADCLPAVTLVDQHGDAAVLASLKGKPVLVNFIYTSCRDICPLLTSNFAAVARMLGPALGARVTMISITLDPEHDDPGKLLSYARGHDADRRGWLFLTGKPDQIDNVLALFALRRRRESDGSIDHALVAFLLGPDGRQRRLYAATHVSAKTVVADVERELGS